MKQRLFRLPLAQQVTRLGTYLSMEVDWVIYPKKAEWIRRPHQKACGPHVTLLQWLFLGTSDDILANVGRTSEDG
jgi:hypothetical protein